MPILEVYGKNQNCLAAKPMTRKVTGFDLATRARGDGALELRTLARGLCQFCEEKHQFISRQEYGPKVSPRRIAWLKLITRSCFVRARLDAVQWNVMVG